jgi:glycosyltransferase involved in cell wall biosynthesis
LGNHEEKTIFYLLLVIIKKKLNLSDLTLELNSKQLLVVSPHFKVFVKDQVTVLRKHLGSIMVVVPIPFFFNLDKLQFISNHFEFAIRHNKIESGINDDFSPIFSNFLTLPIKPLRSRNYYLSAKSVIKKLSKTINQFDLIHTHFVDNGFSGAMIKEIYGKPFVVTAHGGDIYDYPFRDEYNRAIVRYMLNKADQIIAVSNYNAKIIKGLGSFEKKLEIIPNGFDDTIFKNISSTVCRSSLSIPLNRKIILSVGNLVNEKGHTCLIDAMHLLMKKRSDVVLFIIGSGPLSYQLKRRIEFFDLNERIFLVGKRPHNEIPLWMNASDLFVLPSKSEGFPTVINEAFACGKPVIGTKVGGIPEALPNSDIGFLVNPNNPTELSQCIISALEKKWRIDTITNYAKDFSWTNLCKRILKVYNQALS